MSVELVTKGMVSLLREGPGAVYITMSPPIAVATKSTKVTATVKDTKLQVVIK